MSESGAFSSKIDDLARSVARQIEQGDWPAVFRTADRLSRTVLTSARLLQIRARALREMGFVTAADRDIRRALEVDPLDPTIARDALESVSGPSKIEAAIILASSPRADRRSQRLALEALIPHRYDVVGHLVRDGTRLHGFLAWSGHLDPNLRFMGDIFDLVPDADQGLRDDERSIMTIDIDVPRAGDDDTPVEPPWIAFRSGHSDRVRLIVDDISFGTRDARPKATSMPALVPTCTIIVPVFEDIDATALCLEAITYQTIEDCVLQIILVNDNPKHLEMRQMLRDVSAAHGFILIENESNQGFVKSVNVALAAIDGGDVLLLNADAILPRGALARLRQSAYGAHDIGTATPFSNNGEFVSVPLPFQSNPMEPPADSERFDSIASFVNRDRAITIPGGIGFCLFIKAACLDAAGPTLSTIYRRGYYEDADFCMRARWAGFRNVCATDIYVTHIGTRSFKSEKRPLVVRNEKVFQRRFPDIADETLAFIAADPLRSARSLIETAAARTNERACVLIGRFDDDSALLRRMRDMRETGWHVLTLTPSRTRGVGSLMLRAADGTMPQSCVFQGHQIGESEKLVDMLLRLGVSAIEIYHDCQLPAPLVDRLLARNFTRRILVERCPYTAGFSWTEARCPTLERSGPCDACRQTFQPSWPKPSPEPTFAFTAIHTAQSPSLSSTNRMAAALLARLKIRIDVPAHRTNESKHTEHNARPRSTSARLAGFRGRSLAIGVLAGEPSVDTERLLHHLVGTQTRLEVDLPVVVFGDCLDAESLMSFPGVDVTGPVSPEDLTELVHQYEVGVLFGPERSGGFQMIDALSENTGLSQAYFDWSFGTMVCRPHDLSLDPRICDVKAVQRVLSWALDRKRQQGA